MDHPFGLDGKVVLVTGGSRGIGAATARSAAQAGAAVAIGYREDAEAAGTVVEDITARGARAAAYPADVSDAEAARRLIAEVEGDFERIDGLVNNAGIMPSNDFLSITEAEWEDVLRTNLFGPFYCTRAVLPGMIERGGGTIVMISSRLGQIGFPGLAHYAASKAGLLGLTKSLAREYGHAGIRVNAVAPGFTVTDMTRHIVGTEAGDKRLAELPAQRFAEPDDVAAAVVFLLSDAAAAFQGQTLNPNSGGYMP